MVWLFGMVCILFKWFWCMCWCFGCLSLWCKCFLLCSIIFLWGCWCLWIFGLLDFFFVVLWFEKVMWFGCFVLWVILFLWSGWLKIWCIWILSMLRGLASLSILASSRVFCVEVWCCVLVVMVKKFWCCFIICMMLLILKINFLKMLWFFLLSDARISSRTSLCLFESLRRCKWLVCLNLCSCDDDIFFLIFFFC